MLAGIIIGGLPKKPQKKVIDGFYFGAFDKRCNKIFMRSRSRSNAYAQHMHRLSMTSSSIIIGGFYIGS